MLLAVVVNRVAMALLTLVGVAIVVFILLRVVPGDPVTMMISPGASPADIAALRAHYGLDAPLLVQFWIWIRGVITGDFGNSITLHLPATEVLASRLPATIELAVSALLVAAIVGGCVAIAGTLMRRKLGELIIDSLNGIMLAVPDFIWALALVLMFAVAMPILPLTGRINPELAEGFTTQFYLTESLLTGRFAVAGNVLSHMVMPTLSLALPLSAVIVRLLKQSLKEAMMQDYVLMARIEGISRASPSTAGSTTQRRCPDARTRRRAVHLSDWRYRNHRAYLFLSRHWQSCDRRCHQPRLPADSGTGHVVWIDIHSDQHRDRLNSGGAQSAIAARVKRIGITWNTGC